MGDGDDDDRRRAAMARAEWLRYLEIQRETLIRQLRHIDSVLVRHGRLSAPTLKRRQR